ncbi:hypothetical protein [Sicyoidochytrium minutum DNA virus]|nr:hypothetical protein [Sicyoidochytrium minutum DNA virus]BDC16815.1 hypothetical protein [Sicyoidochytrium minutum DNA virus]
MEVETVARGGGLPVSIQAFLGVVLIIGVPVGLDAIIRYGTGKELTETGDFLRSLGLGFLIVFLIFIGLALASFGRETWVNVVAVILFILVIVMYSVAFTVYVK